MNVEGSNPFARSTLPPAKSITYDAKGSNLSVHVLDYQEAYDAAEETVEDFAGGIFACLAPCSLVCEPGEGKEAVGGFPVPSGRQVG